MEGTMLRTKGSGIIGRRRSKRLGSPYSADLLSSGVWEGPHSTASSLDGI